MTAFTAQTFSLGAAQAALDDGQSLTFAAGTYDLGTTGLVVPASSLDVDIIGTGDAVLEYSGTGYALELQSGARGLIQGIRLKGDGGESAGVGLAVCGAQYDVRDFEIRTFDTGMYLYTGQVCSFTNGLIQSNAEHGLLTRDDGAHNHVQVRNCRIMSNGVGMTITAARNWVIDACDFSHNKGHALALSSSAGGRFQNVRVVSSWFEKNNADYVPADDRAEVGVDSDGFTVRALWFERCYWSPISPTSSTAASAHHVSFGTTDDQANTEFLTGYPAELQVKEPA